MSHVTYHWTHSYTTLTASMAGRVVNLLIRATNSRKALAITVTRGVAGVGVTVNDTGGKYARAKYYNNLRTVLLKVTVRLGCLLQTNCKFTDMLKPLCKEQK